MSYTGKSKEELIVELKELQQNYDSLKATNKSVMGRIKEVEEAFQESENDRFRKIVEHSPIAMAIVSLDGIIEFINHKAVKVFGFAHEDIPNMDRWWEQAYPDEIYRKEVIADWMQRVHRAIEEGEEISGNEYQATCKDGTIKTVFISGAPVSDKIFILFDDITDRKQMENDLRESEERFSKAYKTSPIAFMIATMKDGRIIEVNDAFTTISGFTREEALASTTVDLKFWVQEEDRQYMMDTLREGRALVCRETRLHTKNGNILTVLLSAQLIQLGHEYCIISSIENISERKNAEESLLAITAKLETLVHVSPLAITLLDNNGNVQIWNTAAEKMFGWSAEEVIGHPDPIVSKDQQIEYNKLAKQILQGNPIINLETTRQRKDGSIIDVSISSAPLYDTYGKVIGRMAIVSDISEKKRAENELVKAKVKAEENELRLLTFINSIPDVVSYKDGKGRWLLSNDANLQLFSLTGVDYYGKTDAELAEYTHEIYKESFLTCMQSDEKCWEGKIITRISEIIPALSGEKKIFDVFKIPIFDAENKRLMLAVIARDITELQNTKDELTKAKEHAEESDRLKTAFLQNMSHEIRTPMNAIMGFSDLLKDEFDDKPRLEKYTEIIKERSNDLLEIINDILDIAKIESDQLDVNLEECNLDELFAELTSFFIEYQIRTGKQNIKFSLQANCNPSEDIIITDKVKLKQIFINLISNAFKFTNEGTILGGCKFDQNHNLIFYVSDTGIGIPADKQIRIFDRFVQLNQVSKKSSGGTGLGLSIVKGLVNLLGGEMFLESEPGKGSTFSFTIPYKTPILIHRDQSEVIKPIYKSLSKKTILIVEDDQYNFEYLKEILSGTGSKILVAENGHQAIEISINNPVDLVLMDVLLPDMDGYEVTRQIRRNKPELKIIAQTAYASHEEKQKAIDAGCDDYISKPAKKEALLSMVHKHIS